MRQRILVAAAFVLTLAAVAEAKNLYVNPATGNDATTYANNDINNPWATLCRATRGTANDTQCDDTAIPGEAAQAGDVVIVSAGVYQAVGTATRFLSPFNPANSGTLGNLITFQCTAAGPSTSCELRLSSSEGPVFGCRSRDYIKWVGFYVNGTLSPPTSDTGHIDIFEADGCEVHETMVVGDLNNAGAGGNYNAIRVEASNSTLLKNNDLCCIAKLGTYGGNEVAITLYDSNDTLIEHNNIHKVGVAIYVKGIHGGGGFTQEGTINRFNLLYDIRHACLDSAGDEGSLKYQNICISYDWVTDPDTCRNEDDDPCTPMGIEIDGFAANLDVPATPIGVIMANNVFDGFYSCAILKSGAGSPAYYSDLEFWNNICRNGGRGIITGGSSALTSPGDISFEHNIYSTPTVTQANFGSNLDLPTWKSTFTQDSASPAASANDPLFVNAAAGNYHLQGGSYALTQGRVTHSIGGVDGATIPAGAYITGSECIGIEANCAAASTGPWRLRLSGLFH